MRTVLHGYGENTVSYHDHSMLFNMFMVKRDSLA